MLANIRNPLNLILIFVNVIDGQEWVITESDLGKLLGCEYYGELS